MKRQGMKITKFFKKNRMDREQELFDYCISIGFGRFELRMLLAYWNFNASEQTIMGYARSRGLWELRQKALAARPRRVYKRYWKLKDYVVTR